MVNKANNFIPTLFRFLLLLIPLHTIGAADTPSVKAVLFYPPFCTECPAVIEDFLLPLSMQESDRLQLFPVDITEPPGDQIFSLIEQRFETEPDAWHKPTLLIGGQLLQGEAQITTLLPRLMAGELTTELTAWPELPGLLELINGEESPETQQPEQGIHGVAAVLTWSVMAGMLFSLGFAVSRLIRCWRDLLAVSALRSWSLPVFAMVGLGIGLYLSYVTLTNNQIMCGPIGDCMTVQSSPYARLFGIPMAVWGVVFYLGILLLWLAQRFLAGNLNRLGLFGLTGFSLFGVLFSIYLTSLELFFIHAICLWCLTSAVLACLILLTIMLKTCGENACAM